MAVQGGGGEDVYATLLLTDTYLPGALVLAHSLRDAATTKKLAALVTLDSVSAEAVTQLKSVYDYVIPVPRIRNAQPANLQLMNRTDLHSAFTKINLWCQTQFRKIVYIDADVVAYRAPDELFNIAHPFSAAPDIGWPDLFNTGVMVLTPNMGDYYAMMAMAERGISFDGADQGLINTHFRNNYNRISFAYNVTPSAHYQYIPAYRHFQSSINMVHFIGSDKPWFQGRHASTGSSPFDEMTGRWWAVYDRHYRVASPQSSRLASSQPPSVVAKREPVPALVQYLTKGEYQPQSSHVEPFGTKNDNTHSGHNHGHQDYHATAPYQAQDQQLDQQSHHHYDSVSAVMHSEPLQHQDAKDQGTPSSKADNQHHEASSFVSSDVISSSSHHRDSPAKTGQEQIHAQGLPIPPPEPDREPPPFQAPMSSWDAQRHPPPAESKPEAMNFPATIYEMSKSTAPFIAPQQYPSPPKNMWYEVPKTPPAAPSEPLKPIFPWEASRPKPSRVFVDEEPKFAEESKTHDLFIPSDGPQSELEAQQSAESSGAEASTVEQESQPVTPTTPTIQITPSDPWTSYTRTNAWDEMPEIERYIGSMQKHQRSRSIKSPGVIGLPGPGEDVEVTWRRRGSKVTDFPSEAERPSLPVTPAPINRSSFWGSGSNTGEGKNDLVLPSAVGVPGQGDWDPRAQLKKLAQQHGEELLKRLGGGGQNSSDPPPRLLPLNPEKLVSPTYVAQSTQLLSPQPVKGSVSSSSVLNPAADLETVFQSAPLAAREVESSPPISSSHEDSTLDSERSIPI